MKRVLASLNTSGFAVLRGVFSPLEIETLREGFDALVRRARQAHDDAQFVVEHEPFRLHRVVWCGSIDPRFEAVGADPRILRLASLALGSKDLVQLIGQAHFKLPGDGVDFAWHQDASNRRYGTPLWTDVNGRGSFVQIAIAIDPMTETNGPLRVIPGSHDSGFVADPRTGALPEGAVDLDAAEDLRLDPGDVALFGPFLLHGSPPNRSQVPRRLLLCGYTVPGANRRVYPGCGTGVPRRLED